MSRAIQSRIEQLVRERGIPADPDGPIALYEASSKLQEEHSELCAALYAVPDPQYVALRVELADMLVVLCRMACILERVTGQEFDLMAEALAKAERDVKRPAKVR